MPKVFISYSWDSPEHRAWVRAFAGDLLSNGVDAWLDQWEVQLGDDVTEFMERGVTQADYVLLVCTENFAQKANGRRGGVGYEQAIVTSELLHTSPNRGRFVCMLRQGSPSSALPRYMQARLWVDCRDDFSYSEAVQQILVHVFRRHAGQKPQLQVVAVDSQQAVIKPDMEPHLWALVAGSGVARAFSPELEGLARSLGEGLMARQCGLVTGGWPGVDEWVARGFAESASKFQVALEDALVQVIVKDKEPAFAAGQLVFVEKGDEEWDEPIRRADVVVLLGGVGGTRKTGKRALELKRPVLPVADSGGDAKVFYVDMLKQWDKLDWMGLTEKEFQRLGRPGSAAIDAALELAVKVRINCDRSTVPEKGRHRS